MRFSYSRFILGFLMTSACAFHMLQAQVIPNRSLSSPTSASSSTSTGLSSTPGIIKHLEPAKHPAPAPTPAPAASHPIKPSLAPKPKSSLVSSYFHPGILIFKEGHWEGGDHLFNLPNHIGIYVEIIRPETDQLAISEEAIRRIVDPLFINAGIEPTTLGAGDQPPLPFFHIQILLYPINRGYTASCTGRLFESVLLKRIMLDPGMVFQAITWEKTSLIVIPTEMAIMQIEKNVLDIVQAFTERFQAYELRRRDMMSGQF